MIALTWLYLLIKSIIFFLAKEVNDNDLLFSTKENTFKNVFRKFEILEKITDKDLSYYKKQVNSYYKNAKRTRRKYLHYSHLIEPAILNIYLSGFTVLSKSKKSKMMYKKLDVPFQRFITFISYSVFVIAILEIISSFFFGFSTLGVISIILIPLIFAVCLIVIFINVFFLDLITQIFLSLKKKDNGTINRNYSIFSRMLTGYATSRGENNSYIIGVGGIAYVGFGGSSDFGGFGGGDFSGGGAGGSW